MGEDLDEKRAFGEAMEVERQKREAIVEAIRAFTVEGPNDAPNGDFETQLEVLGHALERGDLRVARKAYQLMCGHAAKDRRALRLAAEAYFGGDFRAPGGWDGGVGSSDADILTRALGLALDHVTPDLRGYARAAVAMAQRVFDAAKSGTLAEIRAEIVAEDRADEAAICGER